MTETPIPATMRAYGPEHPDYPNAPRDWDRGPVQFRDGEVFGAPIGTVWKLGWSHDFGSGDVTAYTPKATANPDTEWKPHLDYSGEPMAEGQFRDPPNPKPTEEEVVAEINIKRIDDNRWTVESIDGDGGIQQTVFAGSEADKRAAEYRAWLMDGAS